MGFRLREREAPARRAEVRVAARASVLGPGSAAAGAHHGAHAQAEAHADAGGQLQPREQQNTEKNNRLPEAPQAAIEQRQEVAGAQAQARVRPRRAHPPAQGGEARAAALQARQLDPVDHPRQNRLSGSSRKPEASRRTRCSLLTHIVYQLPDHVRVTSCPIPTRAESGIVQIYFISPNLFLL